MQDYEYQIKCDDELGPVISLKIVRYDITV